MSPRTELHRLVDLLFVPTVIDDVNDPCLDDFRDLKAADALAGERAVVIAEGVNVIARMLVSPYRVRAVFGVPARIEALTNVLEKHDVPAYIADKWMLSDVAGFRVLAGCSPRLIAYRRSAWSRRLLMRKGLSSLKGSTTSRISVRSFVTSLRSAPTR